MKHNRKQRSGAKTWTESACKVLRKDILKRRKLSRMYQEAEEMDTLCKSAEKDGGLRQMFTKQVMVHTKDLVGCLKIVYWLAKEEIPHTTKHNSLKHLAIFLDCDYLKGDMYGKEF